MVAMVTSAFILVTIIGTVTSVVALPLTQPDEVTWSTVVCRHNVDADGSQRPHRCCPLANKVENIDCADGAGRDVMPAVSDVTVDAETTTRRRNYASRPRAAWTHYPFAYDPWLGWYIAAIISGLILTLLLCVGLDRAKHAVIDYLDARLLPRQNRVLAKTQRNTTQRKEQHGTGYSCVESRRVACICVAFWCFVNSAQILSTRENAIFVIAYWIGLGLYKFHHHAPFND